MQIEAEVHLLAVPLYRHHLVESIRAHPASNGLPTDLLSLLKDPPFCTSFAYRGLCSSYHLNLTKALFERTDTHLFIEAVACLYERIRPTLLRIERNEAAAATMIVHGMHPAGATSKTLPEHLNGPWADWTTKDSVPKAVVPLHWTEDRLLQPPAFPTISETVSKHFLGGFYVRDI